MPKKIIGAHRDVNSHRREKIIGAHRKNPPTVYEAIPANPESIVEEETTNYKAIPSEGSHYGSISDAPTKVKTASANPENIDEEGTNYKAISGNAEVSHPGSISDDEFSGVKDKIAPVSSFSEYEEMPSPGLHKKHSELHKKSEVVSSSHPILSQSEEYKQDTLLFLHKDTQYFNLINFLANNPERLSEYIKAQRDEHKLRAQTAPTETGADISPTYLMLENLIKLRQSNPEWKNMLQNYHAILAKIENEGGPKFQWDDVAKRDHKGALTPEQGKSIFEFLNQNPELKDFLLTRRILLSSVARSFSEYQYANEFSNQKVEQSKSVPTSVSERKPSAPSAHQNSTRSHYGSIPQPKSKINNDTSTQPLATNEEKKSSTPSTNHEKNKFKQKAKSFNLNLFSNTKEKFKIKSFIEKHMPIKIPRK